MFKLDLYVFVPCFLLVCLGLTMITSSSLHIAAAHGLSEWHYTIHQLIYLFLGLIVASILMTKEISWLRKKSKNIFLIFLLGLILVLIPGAGHKVNGSMRWLNLGIAALQVSEFMKISVILYVTDLLLRNYNYLTICYKPHMKLFSIWCLLAFLLLLEPDFGALVVMLLSTGAIWFLLGCRLRFLFLVLFSGLALVASMIYFAPYRLTRLTTFFHPWQHAYDSGYQLTQSLIAFGRGGFWGQGLGAGLQKQFYLPEAHTDFLFAVLCEEMGFLAGVGVILLFFIVISRSLMIAKKAWRMTAYYHSLITYGITVWLTLQFTINVSVNMGLLPTKGLTLPFMSYGGSSLIASIMAISIILRVKYELDTKPIMYLNAVAKWGGKA